MEWSEDWAGNLNIELPCTVAKMETAIRTLCEHHGCYDNAMIVQSDDGKGINIKYDPHRADINEKEQGVLK